MARITLEALMTAVMLLLRRMGEAVIPSGAGAGLLAYAAPLILLSEVRPAGLAAFVPDAKGQ